MNPSETQEHYESKTRAAGAKVGGEIANPETDEKQRQQQELVLLLSRHPMGTAFPHSC